jgi:hypothetical protein
MRKRIIKENKGGFFSKKRIIMYLIGGFLILLMVGSVLNMDGEKKETYEYNGIKFIRADIGWIGYLNDKPITLANSPEVIKDIRVYGEGFKNLNSLGKIYLSVNPTDYLISGLSEFSRNIQLEPALIPACFEDVAGCEERPIKDCDDSNVFTGVMIFKTGDNNTINFKNNCLVVEAKKGDMVKVIDRLILEWYEI